MRPCGDLTMFRLSNVRVSYKIAALGAVAVLGLLLVVLIFYIGSESQSRYQKLADDAIGVRSTTKDLLVQLLQLRRNEKDFLLRKDDKYAKTHAENTAAASRTFDQLKPQLAALGQSQLVDKIGAVQAGVGIYSKNFLGVVELAHKLGLTPGTRVEGTLRGSVHRIQAKLTGFKDSGLNGLIVTMRRSE